MVYVNFNIKQCFFKTQIPALNNKLKKLCDSLKFQFILLLRKNQIRISFEPVGDELYAGNKWKRPWDVNRNARTQYTGTCLTRKLQNVTSSVKKTTNNIHRGDSSIR